MDQQPTTPAARDERIEQQPGAGGHSRRRVLTGGATLAAATGLAACGGSDGGSDGGSGATSSAPAGGSSAPAAGGSGSGGGGGATVQTSQVPVGGGYVDEGAKVVVTQPTQGQFKAFTAVCTHEQCLVDQVAAGKIECPCHGSVFNAETGAVEKGPAEAPLAATQVTVEGSTLRIG